MEKKKIQLLTILAVLCISGGLINQSKNHPKSNLEKRENDLILSATWIFTKMIIEIDNLDPNKTWSKVALDNAWCSGSGTWSDPYVIENISLNSQNSGNCIEIKNSNDFFIIRNNYLYNSTFTALYLSNTTNGRIVNNTLTDLFWKGIELDYSNNNTIIENIVTTNGYGFYLDNSQNNTIIQNSIVNNVWDGVNMQYSSNNTLFLNNISSNGHDGLFLSASSHNNLSNNIVNFNQENGIYLYSYYGSCDFNRLQQNNAYFNQKSGFRISGSNNTLLKNVANFNFDGGIE
ncbi:hypothetical protein LCGC14_0653090 [marine sediment metagenome]|uniref:Right handed beta helix domain-containing protein n=1 Tax=marine sediment metagenome TaxID=412755 RepID=A0A0F9RFL0_9ZZZZ|nr:hypothetical protein [bacterium]